MFGSIRVACVRLSPGYFLSKMMRRARFASALVPTTLGFAARTIVGAMTMTPEIQKQLDALDKYKKEHAYWNNSLFDACRKGLYTRDDFKYIFGQYFAYNSKFTRYLSGVMANCDNDYYRAKLSANMWEEGGGAEPEERHSNIFRKFLKDSLGIAKPDEGPFETHSTLFAERFLQETMKGDAAYGAAFLSYGTEGIVAETYAVMVQGMKQAGLTDEELRFFHIHMECDDAHAETLAEMTASYSDQPGWFSTCIAATDKALTLRRQFFEDLHKQVRTRGLVPLVSDIDGGKPVPASKLVAPRGGANTKLYSNEDASKGIKFSVQRVDLDMSVIDPRIVEIPAGKCNETHAHAHETVFYVISGQAKVLVGEKTVDAKAGDLVFVPRWHKHRTTNSSTTEPLVYLGITDYGLTRRLGQTEASYRQAPGNVLPGKK